MNSYKPKNPYQKKAHPELDLQKQCIAWLRMQHPKLIIDAGYYSGIKLDAKRGAMAKAAGHSAGMPDIRIYKPNSNYAGLFIELKAPGYPAKPRPGVQERVCTELSRVGYKVVFCNDFNDFCNEVTSYLEIQ